MPWVIDEKIVTFRQESCVITWERCREILLKLQKKKGYNDLQYQKAVKVRVMDLNWLFANGSSFIEFVELIIETESLLILQSDFITALVEEFWEEIDRKLFWRIFIPHICYMVLTHFYLMEVLSSDFYFNRQENPWYNVRRYVLGILTLYSWTYQVSIEFKQVRKHGFKNYIKDIYNVADVIQYIACMIVVIHNLINHDFVDL